jgi:hypothetical protein
MSSESDDAMKELQKFFPKGAYQISEYLRKANSEQKVLKLWREAQLVKFIASLILNTDELRRGFAEKRITKIAWAARNLLELSIWIDYCNLSEAHAKRFRDDSARDVIGFSKAMQSIHVEGYGKRDKELDDAMQAAVRLAEKALDVTGLDDDFKRVSEAANELGCGRIFSSLNKLFSKFAHPTALALNSATAKGIEADDVLREMFFIDGVDAAIRPLTMIRLFILHHFPLPGISPKADSQKANWAR